MYKYVGNNSFQFGVFMDFQDQEAASHFSEDLHPNPGTLSINGKEGISLSALKSFLVNSKLLV
jgi:hypothetical protein